MQALVTGAAGFIGFHVARALLERGDQVLGVDNLDPYYDVRLKRDRLALLQDFSGFEFAQMNVADKEALSDLVATRPAPEVIVHLAAQAGIRHSMDHPLDYAQSNMTGHLVMLELARSLPELRHFVYASSSSVYGGNTKLPFSESDPTDMPVSLYAATKKADELLSYNYSHLFRIPATGLRFFTVYGPWGRPDMATWLFTEAVLEGRPIDVYGEGEMRRDFTYIDDVVAGVLAVMAKPPSQTPPHTVYNIGNASSENLMDFISLIEQAAGRKAEKNLMPMQPGDMRDTYADIAAARREFGYEPKTSLAGGIQKFVEWYKEYKKIE